MFKGTSITDQHISMRNLIAKLDTLDRQMMGESFDIDIDAIIEFFGHILR